MKTTLLALFACGCVALDAADAASAAFEGSYGSKEGCIYDKTGESSGADDFVLLTPKVIIGSTFSCDITKWVAGKGGSFNVTASCEAEGEEQGTGQTAKITPSGKDAYTINFADGTHLGPVKRCR